MEVYMQMAPSGGGCLVSLADNGSSVVEGGTDSRVGRRMEAVSSVNIIDYNRSLVESGNT